MLNNPLIWWSLFSICVYVSDCTLEFSPSMRKWRASKDWSAPPPWTRTIQNLSSLCITVSFLLSIFSSFAWFLLDDQLLPAVPISKFWEAVIILAGVVSLIKFVNQRTTWESAKAFEYLTKETQLAIKNLNDKEISAYHDDYESRKKLIQSRRKQANKMARIVSE